MKPLSKPSIDRMVFCYDGFLNAFQFASSLSDECCLQGADSITWAIVTEMTVLSMTARRENETVYKAA